MVHLRNHVVRSYLSDGVNTIAFVSSTPVTEGSGWISVCAPIEHCTSGTLPSNANGSWTMSSGMTCTDFNNVLDNVKTVSFPTDITSSPSEVMSIENVCVKNCGKGCQLDFDLSTYFKSDGTARGEVYLNYMVMNATYSVDWGDGAPSTSPFISHIYSVSGTYNVCVTMVIRTQMTGLSASVQNVLHSVMENLLNREVLMVMCSVARKHQKC